LPAASFFLSHEGAELGVVNKIAHL
jgi:hypothetical protein